MRHLVAEVADLVGLVGGVLSQVVGGPQRVDTLSEVLAVGTLVLRRRLDYRTGEGADRPVGPDRKAEGGLRRGRGNVLWNVWEMANLSVDGKPGLPVPFVLVCRAGVRDRLLWYAASHLRGHVQQMAVRAAEHRLAPCPASRRGQVKARHRL